MKKLKSKIVTFALAICLIVPCMFMLTACGDDHTHTLTKVDAVAETCTTDGNTLYYKCDCGKYFSDEEAKTEIEEDSWIVAKTGHSYASTWTYNETHHWKEATCSHSTEKSEYAEHSLTNNACSCGYVAVTYTVADNDAWNEVFTGDYLNNGTINIENNTYQDDVLVAGETNGVIMRSTADAMVMTMTAQSQTESQYLVKQSGVWYGLAEYQGTWYGSEMPEQYVESYTFAGSQGIAFVDRFAEFEYDEENHCYVATNYILEEGIGDEPDTVAEYVKVFIENGKLVGMELKAQISANSYGISSYVFSNYGTTVIDDIPQWTIAPTE